MNYVFEPPQLQFTARYIIYDHRIVADYSENEGRLMAPIATASVGVLGFGATAHLNQPRVLHPTRFNRQPGNFTMLLIKDLQNLGAPLNIYSKQRLSIAIIFTLSMQR